MCASIVRVAFRFFVLLLLFANVLQYAHSHNLFDVEGFLTRSLSQLTGLAYDWSAATPAAQLDELKAIAMSLLRPSVSVYVGLALQALAVPLVAMSWLC
jgi:hypothetical protein